MAKIYNIKNRGTPIKIRGVSHPLKGFYRGLGVVKGEGVAAAKKALPFPLKKERSKIKNSNFSKISNPLNRK